MFLIDMNVPDGSTSLRAKSYFISTTCIMFVYLQDLIFLIIYIYSKFKYCRQ